MKEQIWNSIEEAVAQAIAQVAIEAISTGVILITRKLKALQEQEGTSCHCQEKSQREN